MTDEELARMIAVWHGSRMVGSDRESQMQTVASRHGFGRWGHSPGVYAQRKWEEYQNAASAVREALAPTWRPIETAPKDGRVDVLVWDGATMWVAHYAWDDKWQPEGMPAFIPTHWMPLPEPPR